MNCAACNAENSPGAKFCRGCGASLAAPAAAVPIRDAAPAPAAEPGKTGSARGGLLWAIGVIVVAAIAGGGYVWVQHVEEQRVAEEKAAAEAAKQAEAQRLAAEKEAKKKDEAAHREAARKAQHEKEQAEAARQAADAAAAKKAAPPAKSAQVAQGAPGDPCAGKLGLQREQCTSCNSQTGLKKLWCEERARERYCSTKTRGTQECP